MQLYYLLLHLELLIVQSNQVIPDPLGRPALLLCDPYCRLSRAGWCLIANFLVLYYIVLQTLVETLLGRPFTIVLGPSRLTQMLLGFGLFHRLSWCLVLNR